MTVSAKSNITWDFRFVEIHETKIRPTSDCTTCVGASFTREAERERVCHRFWKRGMDRVCYSKGGVIGLQNCTDRTVNLHFISQFPIVFCSNLLSFTTAVFI